MASAPNPSVHSKDNPFPAKITENRLLSGSSSKKETRHFVVDLNGSDLTYKAGDSLGVQPTNRPADVEEMLARLGADGTEPVSPAVLKLGAPIALREALFARLSLAAPLARNIAAMAERATAPDEKSRLTGLLAPEAKETLTGFLREREFPDLLAEFPSVRFSAQELTDQLRKLMPRLYSVASSPRVYPHEVHLTIAVVRYRTHDRERGGVCSTYLADRVEVGVTPVPVFVSRSHFGPPEDPAQDCIMVGPGTGIAPFRAFLQERVATGAPGRNWVFFGDQRRAGDFLYEDEWKTWLDRGQLAHLSLAWSRDQDFKIYVQDRMRENAARLWSWISGGAAFYVCGDAKRMAKDVDTALHEIIAKQGGMSPEAAVEYVKQLKKERRYQRDIY